MRRRRAIFFAGVFFTVALAVGSPVAAKSFNVLPDTDKQFSHEVPGAKDTILTIQRQVVEGIRLGGRDGYTAFLVRRRPRSGAEPPQDTLTVFASGQYRLLAYDARDNLLYACRIREIDGGIWISGALLLQPGYGMGQPIGPPGKYQYVSMSPDGDAVVLVDQSVTVVEVATGKWKRLAVEPALAGNEANSLAPKGSSLDGLNLTGTYVEMVWKSGQAGTLEIRDAEGNKIREIAVDATVAD